MNKGYQMQPTKFKNRSVNNDTETKNELRNKLRAKLEEKRAFTNLISKNDPSDFDIVAPKLTPLVPVLNLRVNEY
jgi:hypothetical protein